MNIGILFEDLQNRVLYHNPAFRRIWLIAEDVDLRGQEARAVMKERGGI